MSPTYEIFGLPLSAWGNIATFAAAIAAAIALGLMWRNVRQARLTARAASRAAQAATDTVGAMRRSERAYVTMSARGGYAAFEIEIKNHGRTPATITDVLLQLDWFGDGNPAPDRPPYRIDGPRKEVGFFLVTQAHFFHTDSLPIPNEGEGNELWLYGFVDYTDEFGQDHRGGYARVYCDTRAGRRDEKNNLVFVDKVGWNYDCPRLTYQRIGDGANV